MLNSLSFDRVKEGDQVSAKQYNKLLDTVERLAGIMIAGGHMIDGPGGPVFFPSPEAEVNYVELGLDIVGSDHDRTVNDLHVDPDIASGTDPWIDFGTDSAFVMPPHDGLWLAGERNVLFRHSGAGKNVLMPFTQVHLARLDAVLTAGGSANASVFEIAASGESNSTRTITVHDRSLKTGESLAAQTDVIVVEHRQSRRFYVVSGRDLSNDIREGVLDGALAPATAAKTGQTTATLSVYTEDASGVHDSGDNVTVTNRMTEVATIVAGTWMVVHRLNGEWRPIAADCAATTLD